MEFDLKVLSRFHPRKNTNTNTWQTDIRQLKSVHYTVIKQASKEKLRVCKNCRVYRGMECGSDHYLLKTLIETYCKLYISKRNCRNKNEMMITKFTVNGQYDEIWYKDLFQDHKLYTFFTN